MKILNSVISKKGQITIPSYIRDKLHLSSGSKLEFVMQDNSFIVIPINKSINNLQGILPRTKMSLSIEDINEVIKGKHDRN
ncbi:AbrB/MazE/SpoVT family DNA-binding domain-containing protein [Candidatus Tisiphia endosymbiont of Sialis lutaria]|uniref:AbrB/MazE/SpoVT family DNA-binding domain-containing protein n=1 Tax=Candidatus Tisiphia endosymbiont of Sialis lutaria TaxID=2029164 RepID=UPI0025C867C2|nr:AbrB/MazE/SpoVT family DNA-binding domain-containing protein [Candidatus Tisiphia sp.]